MKTNENKITPKSETNIQKQNKLTSIDAMEQEELKPFMVEVSKFMPRTRYIGKPIKWGNYMIKKEDLSIVEEIEARYDKQREDILREQQQIPSNDDNVENTKSKKQLARDAGEILRNIKLDVMFVEQIKQDLINQKYKPEDAEKIAILVGEISADEKRIEIINENPKIKNGLKELKKIEKRLNENIIKRDNLLITNSEKIEGAFKKRGFFNFIKRKKEIIKNEDNQKHNISNTFPPFTYNIEEKFEIKEYRKKGKEPNNKEQTALSKNLNTFPPFAYKSIDQVRSEIKQDMENAENERIENITQEELLDRLDNLIENREIKLESSIKGKIINGLDKWEKFGQGESGPKGFTKRMTKNAINLALIGVISSVAVDKLAEAEIGSATALGGGVFSYAGRKMAIGLGFGAAFDRIGNKLSASENKKFVETTKKVMPYIIGVGSVTAATLMTGGMAGAAAGAGFVVSKFIKGFFTKEKIEARQEKYKEKLLAEIRAKGETISIKDEERYEMEMKKIIKKFENQKIWGRLIDGATKLTIASTISAITLEASGIAKDHLHNNQEVGETKNITGNENTNQQSTDKTQEMKTPDDTMKTLTNESSTKMAIKLGMYDPTAEDGKESLMVQNGDITFDDGQGNTVLVDYSSKGAIQTMADLKEALHEKFGDNIPEGKLTTHYTDMNGTEHDQILINIDAKGETTLEGYKGDMFDSDHSNGAQQIETTPDVENNDISKVPEQTNPETGEPFNVKNIQETPHVDNNDNFKIPEQVDVKTDNIDNNSVERTTPNTTPRPEIVHNGLTQIQLDEVHKLFDNNVDHLFGERPGSSWEYIQNNVSAERIMEMTRNNEIKADFRPLVEHLKDLQKLTGVNPQGPEYGLGGIIVKEAETIPHFMGRALEEAYKKGIIDKVTL